MPTEYDELSGYPKPGSSPATGAENEGGSPPPGEAAPLQPQDTRHEPPPGHPRWNQIYRENQEMKRQLAELQQRELESTFTSQPEPTATPTAPTGDDDVWGELRNIIRDEVTGIVKPIRETVAQQQQRVAVEQARASLRSEFPDYNPTEDDGVLVETMKRYGVQSLAGAFRIAFPERVTRGVQPQQQAPLADIPAAQAGPPMSKVQELRQRFATTQDPYEREQIASMLSNMGGYGSAEVEAALGF